MPVLLAVVVLAAVEITGLIVVGQVIGVLATLALLAADVLLGVAVLRRLGMRAVARLSTVARGARISPREIGDGVFAAVAAVLLIIPGFVTDVCALLLVLPPVRAVMRKLIVARARPVTITGAGGVRSTRHTPSTRVDSVIEGEIVTRRAETDPPRGR